MTRRQGRGFVVTAGLLAGLALLLWLIPVRVPTVAGVAEAAEDLPAAPPEWPQAPADVERYAGIVEGNLFSPDRTAPPAETAVGDAGPVASAPRPQLPRFRLSGIVQGPDGFVALIDADPTFPGAELYEVGDSVGPFLLEQATDSLVVLRRGNTVQTLRLDTISGGTPR